MSPATPTTTATPVAVTPAPITTRYTGGSLAKRRLGVVQTATGPEFWTAPPGKSDVANLELAIAYGGTLPPVEWLKPMNV